MLSIVYPGTVNWFYRRYAEVLHQELTRVGVCVELVDSIEIAKSGGKGTVALIVSVSESLFAAERAALQRQCIHQLRFFPRRVLVNLEAVSTSFFRGNFAPAPDLVTDIIDISVTPQTGYQSLGGTPYFWIPESFAAAQWQAVPSVWERRPIPWAAIGHHTPERVALVAATLDILGPNGFVFLPPIRPYDSTSGLDEQQLLRVLRKCNLYIWGSHHFAPYHEGLRATYAMLGGAIPAKIDPVNGNRFREIPWVYDSLDKLAVSYKQLGGDVLYQRAKSFFEGKSFLGEVLRDTLTKMRLLDETL